MQVFYGRTFITMQSTREQQGDASLALLYSIPVLV